MIESKVEPAEVAAIADELKRSIQGEVRFDAGSRALYATDSSNYRQIPIGVVIPKNIEDLLQTVSIANAHGAPILARGGGTSLAGQCCNVAIVMDLSKYLNRILDIVPEKRIARVEPGVVLDDLRRAAERFHLTFGPDPATHSHCTLGGMIGNNSCGVHSVYSGKTVENVEELEILTYDGLRLTVGSTPAEKLQQLIRSPGPAQNIYSKLKDLIDRYADLIRRRYPQIPRRVSGYNLDQLLPENGFHVARALVGTECTCVVVTQATLRLVESPAFRCLVVLGYPDVAAAGDSVMQVLEHKPLGLEGIDETLVNSMRKKNLHLQNLEYLPEGNGWLLVELGGASQEEANEKAQKMIEQLKASHSPNVKFYENPAEQAKVWTVRESGLGATAFVPGERDTWEGWEDAAVPPERVGPYLRDFRRLLDRYEYRGPLYGHFGEGCIHTRINFDLVTTEGIRKFRSFVEEAADLVLSFGGSLSGEHGDGQSRAELLPKMFGPELIRAFEEFKAIWDPQGKMNPGKIVRPYRITENLRLGESYHAENAPTHFHYRAEGSFDRAALRCVGVGKCRSAQGGVMCPSYRATGEEQHSTRGRAHLLFEMLRGEVVRNRWQDEAVKEALDLCLSCKGCKKDCPVQVDMATYKSEFLSHYYEGRLRPAAAYAMGLLPIWCRVTSIWPGAANALLQGPLSKTAKKMAGIATQRQIPAFAKQSFRTWFEKRGLKNQSGKPVLLWLDTFNNYFSPEIAKAAVEVFESAGYRVLIPRVSLCCGRPLYDYGMIVRARKWLGEILKALSPSIEQGIDMVGLEPSCVAVFRDEMLNLFPDDPRAKSLSQRTFFLSEFLAKEKYEPPKSNSKVLVHEHCHQHSVLNSETEIDILKATGADFQLVDSGCCGMAGSFGFEQEHYDLSLRIGERGLLPAIRNASEDTLILTNGFSCREQIQQATGRRSLHLAELLNRAGSEKRS